MTAAHRSRDLPAAWRHSVVVALLLTLFAGASLQAQPFDHSAFDMLLRMYVDTEGMVRYEGFRSPAFDEYLAALANARLDSMGINVRLAFFINAFNACVIRNVLDHWPMESTQNVPNFYTEQRFVIAGRQLSLRDLERQYILEIAPVMPLFALCPGARGGPPLLRRAYDGETVRGQMKRNAAAFMRDRTKNHLDRTAAVLSLSQLFRDHRSAIVMLFGSLRQFAMQYLPEEQAEWLSANTVEIRYLPYEWTLNTQ